MTIALRPFQETDFEQVLTWIDSPELMVQWAGPIAFTFPLDVPQLQRYLQESLKGDASSYIYAALDEGGEMVGMVELASIFPNNYTASICRVFIDPARRGRGYCTEMIQEILKIGFEQFDLRRIDLRVYGFNHSAIHCYERASLVFEGILRKSQKMGDQVWDTVLMAILREDWEANRKEKWL